jgi:hypothetical protein
MLASVVAANNHGQPWSWHKRLSAVRLSAARFALFNGLQEKQINTANICRHGKGERGKNTRVVPVLPAVLQMTWSQGFSLGSLGRHHQGIDIFRYFYRIVRDQ